MIRSFDLRRLTCVLTTALMALTAAASEPPAGNESGELIDAPGARIYVELTGAASGTPLVMVNGGPGFDHSYFHSGDSVWQALGRPVVFYDQRGVGRSPALADGQSCTLADQIEDLDAVLGHLGTEKADLLGHSWGGYLVMAYAARHPERIRRLVIVDSAAPKWGDTLFLFEEVFPETVEQQDLVAFAEALGDADAAARGVELYLSMLFYSTEKRDAFLDLAPGFAYEPEINRILNADLARFDLNPELGKFRFPTLVITGRFDMNVAPSVAHGIHRSIPGSEFAVFEESGHLPFFEQPEEFLARVREFLDAP